ncbi:hypothetical protein OFC03_31560, partial [Escherichia coli]|nr:hypothetical protein [Escherichia coli]
VRENEKECKKLEGNKKERKKKEGKRKEKSLVLIIGNHSQNMRFGARLDIEVHYPIFIINY